MARSFGELRIVAARADSPWRTATVAVTLMRRRDPPPRALNAAEPTPSIDHPSADSQIDVAPVLRTLGPTSAGTARRFATGPRREPGHAKPECSALSASWLALDAVQPEHRRAAAAGRSWSILPYSDAVGLCKPCDIVVE